MVNLRKKARLNRILVLALALLISNVAALSCAMAYALCVEAQTDCPQHSPVKCEEPCVRSNSQIAETSSDVSSGTFRPTLYLPAPAVADREWNSVVGHIAEDELSCDLPSLPLRLRFCVFLN